MRVTSSDMNFSNGFDDSSDIFYRKSLYEQIIRVVTKSPDENLVLALNDRWGNGKTSFVKMMESEILKTDNSELNVIYFDAFKHDYQADPFISLSSQIYELLEDEKGEVKKLGEKLLSASKRLGVSFLTNGAKFAITSITAGLVSNSALDKAGDAMSNAISSPLEKYIEDRIRFAKDEERNIETFKDVLKQIHAVSNKRILFIIDELDRARPDYSLDLLEKVKHLFSVQGLVFLLVVNREQFEKSIECRYGSIDSRLYLNKFIHYWFTLPKTQKRNSEIRNLYKKSTIETYLQKLGGGVGLYSSGGIIVKTLAYLLDLNNCSLREAERCYSVMAVLDNRHIINDFATNEYAVAFCLVTYLKVINPTLIDDLIMANISCEQALKSLNIPMSELGESNVATLISKVISYTLLSNKELEDKREKNDPDIKQIERMNNTRVYHIEEISSSLDLMHISFR
ncbi:MAG: KAP family NTPase [Ewingella americana]|jgi:hypothetical protein|uniref:KAP family P-loop NTPase fold protein n=1 Tax=Ewingella americana TaxID=41202 RepID=UPI00242FE2E6|nr:P-loop NTPase fold protein [Ewingella americana]MCI1678423.1 KAP family NTPase [Ewingella americana]MCI1854010.1 KAP family NTPase [Ewingella americana]MCI1861310.1 KAP family NTPase [Ewingella americana]MCI2144442.1 KAP family NTPase [Ewingella americana]MCI2163707.1 KAP family NTPase [Ewingella americana]